MQGSTVIIILSAIFHILTISGAIYVAAGVKPHSKIHYRCCMDGHKIVLLE
jgi:hypothetical protein